MKKFNLFLIFTFIFLSAICGIKPVFVKQHTFAQENSEAPKVEFKTPKASLIAIVIDDFGGYERAGVNELLNSDIDITCAIIPFADNSQADYNKALENNKEVILHMPMEAHVNLPQSWYGSVYIHNNDTGETAVSKLVECLDSMPQAKGFNIHIGSGASQNQELMQKLYEYSVANDKFFLDSRTIINTKCKEACACANGIYLGRDVFLEPQHNKSYAGITTQLNQAAELAATKGYAIVIGHVGAEGGTNTARAIIDFSKTLDDSIKIVPLSDIYTLIKNQQSI